MHVPLICVSVVAAPDGLQAAGKFAQFSSLFENLDGDADLLERETGHKARNTGAGDQYF